MPFGPIQTMIQRQTQKQSPKKNKPGLYSLVHIRVFKFNSLMMMAFIIKRACIKETSSKRKHEEYMRGSNSDLEKCRATKTRAPINEGCILRPNCLRIFTKASIMAGVRM